MEWKSYYCENRKASIKWEIQRKGNKERKEQTHSNSSKGREEMITREKKKLKITETRNEAKKKK